MITRTLNLFSFFLLLLWPLLRASLSEQTAQLSYFLISRGCTFLPALPPPIPYGVTDTSTSLQACFSLDVMRCGGKARVGKRGERLQTGCNDIGPSPTPMCVERIFAVWCIDIDQSIIRHKGKLQRSTSRCFDERTRAPAVPMNRLPGHVSQPWCMNTREFSKRVSPDLNLSHPGLVFLFNARYTRHEWYSGRASRYIFA